jgi:hypothetical protein
MLSMTLINPRYTVHLESGLGLDAIGNMKGVDLPRDGMETDDSYRRRLMVRVWEWRGPAHEGETGPPTAESSIR